MADVTVTSDVHTFMQSANQTAMRTNIGAGTIATQNANNVSITGGSVTGITDLAIADGGTGAGTAAAARTNLEVYSDAEVDAKVATKAVAGGVAVDGVAGLAITTTQFFSENTAKAFTVSFWVKPKVLTSSNNSAISFGASVSGSTSYGGLEFGWRTSGDVTSGWNIRWQTGGIATESYLSVSNINYNLLNTWHHLTLTSDGSNYDLYLNSELVDSETTAVYPYRSSNTNLRIGSRYTFANTSYFNGNVGPVRIFNRALSAAEVADLYESGTVAVADRWGENDVTADGGPDFANATDGGTGSQTVFDFDLTGVFGNQSIRYTHPIKIGDKVTLTISGVTSSGGTYSTRINNYAGTAAASASIAVSGDGTYTYTSTVNDSTGFRIIVGAGNFSVGSFEATIDDVSVLGAIADLPLDEGIGYQFHDRSSNHFDALASTTGVTHLVPKQSGKVRVKAADASSAMYMLRADSILPTDSIISNVLSEQCYVDLTNSAQVLDDYRIRLNPSGSDLQIQRSDGSNHATLGTVTAPSSLSNVDVEVHYEQVAR